MMKFRRLREDDEKTGLKAGDIILVAQADYKPYIWKCVGKLEIRNDSTLNTSQLEKVTEAQLLNAVRDGDR